MRTIIYHDVTEERELGASMPKEEEPRFGGPTAPHGNVKVESTRRPKDDYKDKLVKYVPAEVVAFFAPIASLVQDRPSLLVASGVVGLIATPGYLWVSAKPLSPARRPPVYYYVLSTLAFAVWALATSRLGTMAGLDSVGTGFILGVTVFLIPLVDSFFAPPRSERPGSAPHSEGRK